MFIQVIEGRIRDGEAMKERVYLWSREVARQATGYLGSTHGLASDGTWISVVRFESERAARRNSERPEQSAWWTETSALFVGEVRFDDSTEVDVIEGGSDDAGFVQVLRGRTRDTDAFRAFLKEIAPIARQGRPYLLGAVYAWHGERFTNTVYFTSEDAAREGERSEPPPHMSRWRELVDEMRFLDLRDPILLSR